MEDVDAQSLWCAEDLQDFRESERVCDSSSCTAIRCRDEDFCVVDDDDFGDVSSLLKDSVKKEMKLLPDREYCNVIRRLCHSQLRDLRDGAVSLIIKLWRSFNFSLLTLSTAVNFLDRYLSRNLLQQWKPWMMELAAVGCLSIAAKMEEVSVPSLTDLLIAGTGHVFAPSIAQRMELTILKALDWNTHPVTVFNYSEPIVRSLKLDLHNTSLLNSRITELLFATISVTEFLEFRPSIVALSAVLCALQEQLPLHALSYFSQLCCLLELNQEEQLWRCYQCMEDMIADPISPCTTPLGSKSPWSPSTVLRKMHAVENLDACLL